MSEKLKAVNDKYKELIRLDKTWPQIMALLVTEFTLPVFNEWLNNYEKS